MPSLKVRLRATKNLHNLGIGYSVGRVPMAGCDFSVREYSYDDVDGDFNLTNFALVTEDLNYKVHQFFKGMQIWGQSRSKIFSFSFRKVTF
jgi:hypothetical protein